MEDITFLLKQSPYVIVLVILGYIGKLYIEKKFNSLNQKINEISKSSLSIKQDLRGEERQALIDFRVAIERWEHHLFSGLTNFSNNKIDSQAITDFYDTESALQLEVKIALARLGIVLQNEETYSHAHPTIGKINDIYVPLIGKYLPILIDLQTELEPLEFRQKKFMKNMEEGNKIELTVEQAKADQQLGKSIQAEMTQVVQDFSNELLRIYPKLVEQLVDLKVAMNEQVYRPVTSDRIDQN